MKIKYHKALCLGNNKQFNATLFERLDCGSGGFRECTLQVTKLSEICINSSL